jgi:hypothetical protein
MTTFGVNADDVSRLWLNPTSFGGAEPAPDFATRITDFSPGATSGDMNFFGSFLIRRVPSGQTNVPGINGVALDELRFGTSYALVTPLAVVSGSWKNDADGNYSDPNNWIGPVPNGAGATANFGGVITIPRTVTVDSPQTVGTINFNSSVAYALAGSSTLTIDSSTAGAINVLNGSHTISAPVVLAKNTTVTVGPDGSTLTMSGNLTANSGVTLTKAGSGVLQVSRVRADGLNVNGGDLAVLPDGSDTGASNVKSLAIATNGPDYTARLNLNNNAMVIDYTGGSPLVAIQSAIASGYHGGDWTGTGITSDTAANVAVNPSQPYKTAIGFAEATDLFNTFPQTFHGQTIDDSSILLAYTLYGDADLNRSVDTIDFNILAANFSQSGQRWSRGDFNFDGSVDTTDFNLLAANFSQTLSAGFPGALVPEPGCAAALLALLIPRRRARAGRVHA